MAEIEVILKKYDCGAIVTLASPGYTEFLYEISPSWSCAWFERLPGKDGLWIRVRAELADYPSKGAQRKAITDTVSMFLAFAKRAEADHELMTRLVAMIGKTTDILHWEHDERGEKP